LKSPALIVCVQTALVLLAGCAATPPVPTQAVSTSNGRPFEPKVVLPGQGQPTEYLGDRTLLLFRGRAGRDDVAILESTLPPRTVGAPPHIHHHEDEYFYVLEGEITLLSGDKEIPAPAGTLAALPREVRHAYWNASDKPARVLLTIVPGAFAQFFFDVAAVLKQSGEKDPKRIGEVIAVQAKRYGCDVYLSQLPPIVERHGLR
jgi:quercetin dioxygenase-like cupin family protein